MKIKLLFTTLLLIAAFIFCTSAFAEDVATYYVSSSGSTSSSGLDESVPTTLAAAYLASGTNKKIILLDSVSYTEPSAAYSGKIEICGNTSSVVLTLPSTVTLKGELTFDSVTLSGATIYAAGYPLTIGTGVTSSGQLTVYGGGNGTAVENTNITLLGGTYGNVYGGGNNANVTGNTNVIFGGNSNAGMGINDQDTSTLCPTYVYGGCAGSGKVLGSTNITLKDSAVAKYVIGAGSGTAADNVKNTNIYVEGGKVLGVYGGSVNGATLSGCDTHITVTGGLMEQIFGGSQSSVTGNTYVYLFGGDVSRRVYSGCYNGVGISGLSIEYSSDYYVTGTTNLVIGPEVNLATETELAAANKNNRGVYSGSRTAEQHDAEQNTLIFLDGCYDAQKGNIAKDSKYTVLFWSVSLNSFQDYTVTASAGGTVSPTAANGVIYIKPDKNNYGQIDSSCYIDENASISTGTTAVDFGVNFEITSVSMTPDNNGTMGTVKYIAKNVKNRLEPKIFVGLYGEKNRLLDAKIYDADALSTSAEFESATTAIAVKAMLIDGNGVPLADFKTN